MSIYVSLWVFICIWWMVHPSHVTTAAYDKLACPPGDHVIVPNDHSVAPDNFTVHWTTSINPDERITVQVTRAWSPLGADRFYQLVQDNFFNCAAFFRVVPGFVVQFGLAAEPSETKKWKRNILDDPANVQTNAKGTLTFATGGPNTRTTQLFVNVANNGNLDGQGFTPFGIVTEGIHLLEKIYNPTPKSSGGIDQGSLSKKGNAWLLQKYPKTEIITCTQLVLPEEEGGGSAECLKPASNANKATTPQVVEFSVQKSFIGFALLAEAAFIALMVRAR